jgi:CheY-like chemotaxis protein
MADTESFIVALQDALNHLDDRIALEGSPLLAMLSLMDSEDPVKALQQALTDAIRALEPAGLMDADAVSRRRYEVLHGRYLDHLTQRAVAERLGVGARHLRRVQDDAVEWLSRYLAMEFDLKEREPEARVRGATRPEAGHQADINREMRWLIESSREQTAEVAIAIHGAMDLAEPLAERYNVRLAFHCDTPCPTAALPETILRQILLNLVSGMIPQLPAGSLVTVVAHQAQDLVKVSVTASPAQRGTSCLRGIEGAGAEMSRRLAALYGGEVVLAEADGVVVATVSLSTIQREFTVLAIEDNQDTLRMWRRFLQQTCFQLVEAVDPTQALDLAAELQPDVVVLDIMLGGVDGWDLLRRLRKHPATSAIPVVVCSVLPQQPLAESLGAAGFIRKPVTGRDFRAAVASQTAAAVH